MDELNTELRTEAINLGLCSEWKGEWMNDKTQDELVKMYKKGIDFAIQNNYPSNGFIKEHFSRDVLSKNNVFVDDAFDLKNIGGVAVFNGKSNGRVRFDGTTVCDMYVRHDTRMTITAKGMSRVFVNAFDNAEIEIRQSEIAKVYVYFHGNNVKLDIHGDVLLRKSTNL